MTVVFMGVASGALGALILLAASSGRFSFFPWSPPLAPCCNGKPGVTVEQPRQFPLTVDR